MVEKTQYVLDNRYSTSGTNRIFCFWNHVDTGSRDHPASQPLYPGFQTVRAYNYCGQYLRLTAMCK
jgi:hypothetical protein